MPQSITQIESPRPGVYARSAAASLVAGVIGLLLWPPPGFVGGAFGFAAARGGWPVVLPLFVRGGVSLAALVPGLHGKRSHWRDLAVDGIVAATLGLFFAVCYLVFVSGIMFYVHFFEAAS